NNGKWRPSAETVAYPMLDEVQRLGLRLVNVHKGLATLFGQNPEYVRATDFPKVVADWPQLRFCAYHAGYFFPGEHPEGKAGISELIEVVEGMPRKHQKRVYAEIGSTFVAALLFDGPDGAAHLMGQLLKTFGSKRILWGPDPSGGGPAQVRV